MNQNVDDQGCLRARRSALKEQILSNNLSCFFEYDDIIFSKAEKTINMLQLKQSHLRFFIAVAELRSVSLAARKLHRSPSAVSMTITNLEAQLGRDLFEAEGKSRLTPFGQYVFDVASEQIGRFDRTADGIFAFSRNEIGRVDIASVPSFATHYLPGLLAGFIELYPQVSLSIRDDSSARINHLVARGEIDVGIASPGDGTETVRYRELMTDEIGVVCSRSHPLASLDRPLVWNDLESHTFIENGTCELIIAEEFRELLDGAEIKVENTTSLLALVAAGVGITTLPRLAVRGEHDEVVFLSLGYDDMQRGIGIITPSDRTLAPAAMAFVQSVMESCARSGL